MLSQLLVVGWNWASRWITILLYDDCEHPTVSAVVDEAQWIRPERVGTFAGRDALALPGDHLPRAKQG
jgi:hypothetical protein